MTASRHSGFLALAGIACLLGRPTGANAQGGVNGSIVGNVFDQTGQPLPGVKVVATSPTQIGGTRTAYSNDEGAFRLPGLQPGTFEIRATSPKLVAVVQKDVRVGINAPAEVNLVMEVEAAGMEEVRVVEKAPVVSTTTAHVKEVYDEDFVDQLPLDIRTSIENFVGSSVAGAVDRNIAQQPRIRGGGNNQNAFLVEGFFMNGQKITHKALAAFEVQTAGYGAEHATAPGGVVNMVTKSGSNRFEMDISAFAEDSTLRFFLDGVDTPEREWVYYLNPNFSGPIIKDRLWYFVNLETRSDAESHGKDPGGFFPDPPRRSYGNLRGSAKLTWQINPRNKLQSFSNFNRDFNDNMLDGAHIARDAQQRRENLDYFTGLIWESILGDNLLFRSQAGVSRFWQSTLPEQCRHEPDTCDHVPAIVQTYPREMFFQNFNGSREQRIQRRFQLVNTLEWYARSRILGDHNVKLKDDFFIEEWESALSRPGDQVLRLNGQIPDRRTEYYSNDPRIEDARYGWFIRTSTARRNALSLTDAFRPTRFFTLTPGVSLVQTRGDNSLGETPVDRLVAMPSAALAWDATHDGRTALRASFSTLADVDVGPVVRHSLGSQVGRECRWDDASQSFSRDCRFSGGTAGRTFGLPCGPGGVGVDGTPCREDLHIPRTWEYTAGAERELVTGVSLSADFIYRLYTDPYEQRETNRIWNAAGTALDADGGYRNGRAQTVNDLGTPAEASRRYVAVTSAIKKREGAVKVVATYTWSRLSGNVFDGNNNPWGNIGPRDVYLSGDLPDDARHTVQTSMTWSITSWLSAGMRWSYSSGRPYSRFGRNDETGQFEDLRARVGWNPGANVNDPADDRPLRLPDIQRLNLQVRASAKPLIGVDIEGYLDALNVLALRTVTAVEEVDGSAWGAPTSRMRPLQLRLGLRYKF